MGPCPKCLTVEKFYCPDAQGIRVNVCTARFRAPSALMDLLVHRTFDLNP